MNLDQLYIKRCLEIASLGIGTTRPNPSVGCVIVHNKTIIGEGFTSPYGGAHAEVNAINSVKDKSLLNEASLYVTLEPCSHYGKTPPCSDLIIKHNIPRVIIGCIDDDPKVAGKGIKKLKNAGCSVDVGVLEKDCKKHHKRFFTFHNKKRPYIILKWAESKDGFIAPKQKNSQRPVWITTTESRQLVHKWRTEEHAILVGTKTVIADNPNLTSRDWVGNNPIRIVLDRTNRLPTNYNVFNDEAETLVISNKSIDFNLPIAKQICDLLYRKNIQSVIIEGGTKTLQTFIDENLWDEARIFTGTIEFSQGIKAPKLNKTDGEIQHIKQDSLKIIVND